MDGEARGITFEQDPAKCNVYKDAFAAPSIPRSRPWERASVSAHAPRLHGHKIWKRAASKAKKTENQENYNISQLELEKEGVGARKRARICGRKEHISEAPWQPLGDAIDASAEKLKEASSPNKQNTKTKAIVFESPDKLRVVPRKRTNANHLITPRKHSQRVPLKDLTQPAEKTPRKSPRKQPPMALTESGESLTILPLNDVGTSDFPNKLVLGSPKKSIRRKSLRQSTRRLTTSEAAVPSLESVRPLETSTFTPEITTSRMDRTAGELLESQKSIEYSKSGTALPPSGKSANEHASTLITSAQSQDIAMENTGPSRRQSLLDGELGIRLDISVQIDPFNNGVAREVVNDVLKKDQPSVGAKATPRRSSTRISSGGKSPVKDGNTKLGGRRRSARSSRGRLSAPDAYMPDIQEPEPEQILEIEATDGQTGPEIHEPLVSPLQNEQRGYHLEEIQEIETTVSIGSAGQQLEHNHSQINEQSPTEPALQSTRHSALDPSDKETQSPVVFVGPSPKTTQNSSDKAETPRAALEYQDSILCSPEDFDDEAITVEIDLATPVSPKSDEDTDDEVTLGVNVSPEVVEPDDDEDAHLEDFEPISMSTVSDNLVDNTAPESENLPGSSTPDPTTSELVETISVNALPTTYDHDDTDLLRNFLSRVKANKEAKAKTTSKRKRSFPHSPLRLPLGGDGMDTSPTPIARDEFDVSLPSLPSTKTSGKQSEMPSDDEDVTEPRSVRRSGRTRLPVKTAAPVPSFIPVRRLGQDGDNTLTLKRNEDKELAALTRVNTRKNKAGGVHPFVVLARLEIEKHDPAARQRALKEKFDEKSQGGKSKKEKRVVWAEEIAQYQSAEEEKKEELEKDKEKPPGDEKKGAVRVGVRSSRISLGMAMNGTPAPKRKAKARS